MNSTPKPPSSERRYTLPWQFVPRVASEHLGSQKYSTTSKAIGELVANAFDAGATVVDTQLEANALQGVESITISDNGRGMVPAEIASRFIVVGVRPSRSGDQAAALGRFGVGRLAVHRIGSLSEWTTIADVGEGRVVRSSFTLRSEDEGALEVKEEALPANTPSGTTIRIFNIRDSGRESPTAGRVQSDLLHQYCSYLLGNPGRTIRVQGEALSVEELIERRETEPVPASEHVPVEARIDHLLLKRPVDQTRFPKQVLFTAKGRTVATAQPDEPPSAAYLGLVECSYLDTIVSSSRETLIEMDEGFAHLADAALHRIRAYGTQLKAERKHRFIERARQEDFYPFRNAPSDAVTQVRQAVYDVVLDRVNDHANLEGMTKRQQTIVFRLLQRALENESMLEVLQEVAKLSDDDVEKFRRVLERTTLDSIVRLSSEVTTRLGFLDVLHELVYGDQARHLKERTQLHRIIEPNGWMFDGRFHLATSDKSFREIVARHREAAGLDPLTEIEMASINGVGDIPDLFLVATRDYPMHPKHHHLLVEIKAPAVPLGKKERDQIHRYAETILDSHEFDKTSTRWDLFLVSANVTREIQRDRQQKGKPHGCLFEWESMTVWALEWSELIARAREEMQLVREHLQNKSRELSVSEYLRENFPEILSYLVAAGTSEADDKPLPTAEFGR